MRKLMLEPGEHHVVSRPAITAKGVHAVDQGIQRSAHYLSERVGVIVVHEVTAQAGLIAEIGNNRVA